MLLILFTFIHLKLLNELLFNEQVNRRSSFYYTIIISILIIFYFRSYTSLKPLKIFIYEGMGIGFISFWIVTIAIFIDRIFNINSYYLGLLSLFFIINIIFNFFLFWI